MTIQYATHVRIICDLEPGDIVRTDHHSRRMDNKDHEVEEVIFCKTCESGFVVTLKGIDGKFDTNWLIKKKP